VTNPHITFSVLQYNLDEDDLSILSCSLLCVLMNKLTDFVYMSSLNDL